MKNLFLYPNNRGVMVILLFLFLLSSITLASDSDKLKSELSHAISVMLTPEPNHYLLRKPAERLVVAQEIITAATEAAQDPYVIAAMAFHESAYKPEVIGKSHGEITVMQVHGRARKLCKLWKLDLIKRSEQFRCGAHYLRHAIAYCGKGLKAGLTVYLGGTCKAPYNSKAAKAVRRRLYTTEKMKRYGAEFRG